MRINNNISVNPTIINLQSLFDLSDKLNNTDDEKFILNSVLLSLMGKLGIIRAAVLGLTDINKLKVKLSKGYIGFEEIEFDGKVNFRELNGKTEFESDLINSGYHVCIPLKYKEHIFAIICLGQKMNHQYLNEIEKQYIQIVATIAGNALQNSKYLTSLNIEKNKVEEKNHLLQTLLEISTKLNESLTTKEIIQQFSLSIMGQLAVNKFAFIEIDDYSKLNILESRLDKNLIKSILEDIRKKNNFELIRIEGAKCLISPIKYKDRTKAWVILCEKFNKKDYDENDKLFIESLSNLTITALENQRLHLEELNKKKLESEMSLALEIQNKLLPKDLPNILSYYIDAVSIPSKYVGGDYYDAIQVGQNRYIFTIADVSGKGMPASLLMANLQSALRILTQFDLGLIELTNRLNKIIYNNTGTDKFITFFICEFDLEKNTLQYLNAGHNPPLLFKKDRSIIELKEGGLILGVVNEEIDYETGVLNLEDFSLLFLFTDGLIEAINNEKQEYGLQRVKSFLIENINNCKELIPKLIDNINEYSNGSQINDDLTMMLIKR